MWRYVGGMRGDMAGRRIVRGYGARRGRVENSEKLRGEEIVHLGEEELERRGESELKLDDKNR